MIMNHRICRLSETPELRDRMAEWFSSKWNVPKAAYEESMDECINGAAAVPEWYLMLDGDRTVGGLGVIENDFHDRKDLAPNVCAVFTEPEYRGRGVAGMLLGRVCRDMAEKGIDTLYLITDHTSFYERYGWEFYCMVQGDGEEELSRLYMHIEDDPEVYEKQAGT